MNGAALGSDHREELARRRGPAARWWCPDHRVEGADAVADLDDQRPEHRERDERELHRQGRAPQHQADRQDRDHRDGLEELDHADDAAVGEAVQPDERADQQRGGDADDQAERPALEGLRRPRSTARTSVDLVPAARSRSGTSRGTRRPGSPPPRSAPARGRARRRGRRAAARTSGSAGRCGRGRRLHARGSRSATRPAARTVDHRRTPSCSSRSG